MTAQTQAHTFGSREDLDPRAQHNRRAPGSNKLRRLLQDLYFYNFHLVRIVYFVKTEMIEVDNFGIVTHTHLILLHAYKQNFITKFLIKFQKNKVWKNRFLEKQVFGKTVFV